MKFASICIVGISTLIIAIVHSVEDETKPCDCYFQRLLGIETPKSKIRRLAGKPHHTNPFPSPRSARSEELTPEEREERVNRGFARMMQFLTFLGHVDNYLTDKAGSLIKFMGRAIETGDDDEEPVENYNRISRHSPTRISTMS